MYLLTPQISHYYIGLANKFVKTEKRGMRVIWWSNFVTWSIFTYISIYLHILVTFYPVHSQTILLQYCSPLFFAFLTSLGYNCTSFLCCQLYFIITVCVSALCELNWRAYNIFCIKKPLLVCLLCKLRIILCLKRKKLL